MHLLALFAAAASTQQATATVRILQAQRATRAEWLLSKRKRESAVVENGRKLTVRLIEFE